MQNYFSRHHPFIVEVQFLKVHRADKFEKEELDAVLKADDLASTPWDRQETKALIGKFGAIKVSTVEATICLHYPMAGYQQGIG